jgi:predicted TIM-barrel fold metal-dependent hydrolase
VHKIFSADDHIIEPPDVWTTRVPARFREVAPHVVEEDGRQVWVYEDQRNFTMGLNAVAGLPREQWSMEPTRYSDMIPGCYDPKARVRDLLAQGVLATVNFPTLPRFGGLLFAGFKDKELADHCVRAWNDFVLDEWCPAGPPGLYCPLIICQVWDPELAAKEIERCAAKGARTLSMPENPVPEGLTSFHHGSFWDPIWRACEETDLPISMHIASSGYVPVADPEAAYASTVVLGEVATMLAMVNILMSQICHRFPNLKLVFSEGGIGWVPALLHRADRQLDRHFGWYGKKELKPSEIFERNMWICMVEEPLGLRIAYPIIGEHKILSEMDYPHADTTFPKTQSSFEEIFAGLPEDVVSTVSHGNAKKLFKWEMADEALLLSPDASSWRATLADDPYAAMSLRRSDDEQHGIEHSKVEVVDDGRCKQMVNQINIFRPCGEPVTDGICAAGHRSDQLFADKY